MNKKERLEKIRHFVSDYEVGTQEAIVRISETIGNHSNTGNHFTGH